MTQWIPKNQSGRCFTWPLCFWLLISFVVILHRNTKCSRSSSSSGKLESPLTNTKGDLLKVAGWWTHTQHRLNTHNKESLWIPEEEHRVCRARYREIKISVWVNLLSTDAIQRVSSDISCLAVTHRGTSKDSHDPHSASLCVQKMGGVDPGRMWRTQSLSPSIYPTTFHFHPPIRPQTHNEMFTDDRWPSWETSLCCHELLPESDWETNGTWCTLDPLRHGPQACISETAPPALSRTRSAWLLARGAWCRECKLRASDVDFLNSERGNGEMLLFFYTQIKNYSFTCSSYGLDVHAWCGRVSSLSSGPITC